MLFSSCAIEVNRMASGNSPAKHGHARGQERLGPDLLLAGEGRLGDEEGDRVDELEDN